MDFNDEWEPSPPTPPSMVETRVEMVLAELTRAAAGNDWIACTSEAMYSLEQSLLRGERLECDRRRFEIDRAIASIRAHALMAFSSMDQSQLDEGFAAFRAQVRYWADSPEDRASCDPDDVADMTALARRLRNDFHDACMLTELVTMWHEHRAGVVKLSTFESRVQHCMTRLVRNATHNVRLTAEIQARADTKLARGAGVLRAVG